MVSRVHYHGGPMWGKESIGVDMEMTCKEVLYKDACALVSYARMDQLNYVLQVADSIVFDNGAFKTHNDKLKGKLPDFDPLKHWAGYYSKVLSIYSRIDWFILPDVIGGTEEENDLLLNSVPSTLRDKAVPVWHSTESIARLIRLCTDYERVAIGLCGEHWKTMSKVAQDRLHEAFLHVYVAYGLKTKIHGLRMLDGRVLGKFPFDSADSSFVAVNVPKTRHQMTGVQCKLARTAIYKNKIESVIPPTVDEWVQRL